MAEIVSRDELANLTRKQKTNHLGPDVSRSVEGTKVLWSRLLATVHNPTLSDQHMTAACNAICFVLRANARSSDNSVRSWAHSNRSWDQTFQAARCAFAAGKNKPALQVLDTLSFLAESSSDRDSIRGSITAAATNMARVVFSQQPRKSLKEACIVLYFFLKKLSDYISFPRVLQQAFRDEEVAYRRLCRAANIVPAGQANGKESLLLPFVTSLLLAIRVAESKSATLKLLTLLTILPTSITEANVVGVISTTVEKIVSEDESAIEDISREMLPSILTTKDQYQNFLKKQSEKATTLAAIQVTLALLEVGKKKDFLEEEDILESLNDVVGRTPSSQFEADCNTGAKILLCNMTPTVRLRTFELLTFSTSPNTPITYEILNCLIDCLPNLHNDTDAFHRGELFSTSRRFLTRLQHSRRALARQTSISSSKSPSLAYDEFETRYLTFLRHELSPQVSYARHVLALSLLDFIADNFQSADDALGNALFCDKSLPISLFRLVVDPYDDVRATAARILHILCGKEPGIFRIVIEIFQPLAMVAELAATTNRADHADAYGRLLCLQASNQRQQDKAVHALAHTITENSQRLSTYLNCIMDFDIHAEIPLHGTILGIKYCIDHVVRLSSVGGYESTTKLSADDCRGARIHISHSISSLGMLPICHRTWQLSQPHLCIDSPETEVDTEDESVTTGPKDVLAYAWRALRDTNLLMQAILEASEDEHEILQVVGDLCFDQLARLRHRGAFSAVAQTFLLSCNKARSSDRSTARDLLRKWFDRALEELETQADRLTRRSAGLPAMFTAILNHQDSQQFLTFFHVLVDIANRSIPELSSQSPEARLRLPQVHALNCIKDLMTASRFRTVTESLVVYTINLAARCMTSPVWAIKNCGLMLLRASINRLDPDTALGASEAAADVRTLSETSHSPLKIGIALLGEQSLTSTPDQEDKWVKSEFAGSTEAEFAGLDLIGRLYIREQDQLSIAALVARKLQHELWHIRAQAARLLASIVPPGQELSTFANVLAEICQTTSQNEKHAKLLVAESLLQTLQDNLDPIDYQTECLQAVIDCAASMRNSWTAATAGSWLKLGVILIEATRPAQAHSEQLHSTLHDIRRQVQDGRQPAFALYETAVQRLASLLTSNNGPDEAGIFGELQQSGNGTTNSLDLRDTQRLDLINDCPTPLRANQSEDAQAALSVKQPYSLRRTIGSYDIQTIKTLVSEFDFQDSCSREVMVNRICLFSELCGHSYEQGDQIPLSLLATQGPEFCLHLQTAASDMLEFDMRLGACYALRALSAISSTDLSLNNVFGNDCTLQILFVLYDLLNDDDDNIRAAASEIAADFATTKEQARSPVSMLSAAASRKRLRNHIVRMYPDSEVLRLECLSRVLNIRDICSLRRRTKVVHEHLQRRSVGHQLREIRSSMNDLFAEEKQNLYIDEVMEINCWTQVLAQQKIDWLSAPWQQVKSWTMEGLDACSTYLTPFEETADSEATLKDSSIGGDTTRTVRNRACTGLCSSMDFELLIVRVITMAGVVGGCDTALSALHELCINFGMSETVTSAFTQSIPRHEDKLLQHKQTNVL